jgi:hypothetical protein
MRDRAANTLTQLDARIDQPTIRRMSPSDIAEQIYKEPFVPLRLTLASGDQIVINNPRRALVVGISIYYGVCDDPDSRTGDRINIISIPNIVLAEPMAKRPRPGRRRR